jgi:SAM-dependent methyltransferase
MITKKEYKKISSRWTGKIYQKWKKIKKRFPMIEQHIEFFKDAKVLELGANAGMYAFLLYHYIKKYIGIEFDEHYYNQSLHTLKGKMDVTLIKDKFENIDIEVLDYDLFFVCYVLHHLNEKEINKLNVIFDKCNKVAISTRSGDPLKYGHDEIGFDPLPKWENSRIKKMLDEHGFKSELHLMGKHDYNGIYLILAEKNDNNQG